MSYQLDLDEYTTDKLFAELARRAEASKQGLCDYCGRPVTMLPACKFPERHKAPPVLLQRSRAA